MSEWQENHTLAHEGHWVMRNVCITCGVRPHPEATYVIPAAAPHDPPRLWWIHEPKPLRPITQEN